MKYKSQKGEREFGVYAAFSQDGLTPKADFVEHFSTGDFNVEIDRKQFNLFSEQKGAQSFMKERLLFYQQTIKNEDEKIKSYGVNASVEGTINYLNGRIGFSQSFENSAVVVDVKVPHVRILVNEMPTEAVSDSNGIAIVSEGLLPLTVNRISLDPETAPAKYDGRSV